MNGFKFDPLQNYPIRGLDVLYVCAQLINITKVRSRAFDRKRREIVNKFTLFDKALLSLS